MKLNKTKKIILSLAVIIFMVLGLGQRVIYATEGNLIAVLDSYRYLPSYDSSTNQYTYNSTNWGFRIGETDGKKVYQINELDSNNNITGEKSRLYCLNARVGDIWTENLVGQKVEYTNYYDWRNNKTSILENDTEGVLTSEYYSAITWLLDNFYIPNVTDKESFMKNIGITKSDDFYHDLTMTGERYYPYHYTGEYKFVHNDFKVWGYFYQESDGSIKDVIIPDEIIETVQQAAIWYFTNYMDYDKENVFDCYTKNSTTEDSTMPTWIYYTTDGSNYSLLKDYQQDDKIGQMYQEQAAILYNYLIDEAIQHNDDGYTGTETVASMTINSTNAKVEKQENGNYKIGPLKIETTGTVSEIILTVKDDNGNDITCTKPSEITVGSEFYIENISSDFEGNVNIYATSTGNITTQTLWTETGTTHQPIVEINRIETPLEQEVTFSIIKEKYFDLALRKTIVGVKNTQDTVVSIINEQGLDATRTITANVATIPDTATYKHRKDPVVVGENYTVIYKIHIFNEGDIDGYASIIVDQLANGLESTIAVGDTVTSSKGNVYTVKSYNNNKIELELTSTSPIAISAYKNNTLDNDTITLECKVTQKENTIKHYLTNIAYINEAKDVAGNTYTQDRYKQEENIGESQPSVYPNQTATELNNTTVTYQGNGDNQSIYNDTNNEYYYKGQEDDDDFETVVLLEKEFDLKLVKYISAINGENSNREITVNTTNLNKTINGTKVTTADYDVSKLPITVEKGDFITYTFRIYNEADLDGYASKIVEDIPEGMKFIYSTLTDEELENDTILSEKEKVAIQFNRNYGWDYTETNGTTISTNYLSREKSINNLIKAYDSSSDRGNGEGLSYKEVSVIFEVTSTDITKIIRNEAAISEDTDKDGQEINDRDSYTNKWDKVNSEEYYEQNSDYPKYVEDDEDYDNIRLVRFDLSLRKFITAISSDINIENTDYLSGDKIREPKVDSTKLKTGENLTAIYNHSKDAITLNAGDYVLYTIRVYNEGDVKGYASEIRDYLPDYLNYIDGEFNSTYGWTYDQNTGIAETRYLSSENGTSNILEAFNKENDDGKGSGLSYKDVQILCRVNTQAVSGQNITNIAEISEYQNEQGIAKDSDPDSDPRNLRYPQDVSEYEGNRDGENASEEYYPGQEDDDDFERVIVLKGSYDIILIKKDENGEQLDSKATFEVDGDIKEVIGNLTIADDVEINASNINEVDEYTIKENIAPDQYSKFNGIIKIQINKKQLQNMYTIEKVEYKVTDSNGNEFASEDAKVYLKDGNIYVEVINHKKEFDLKLVKYISAINNDTSKGKNVKAINTTNLASGKSETADYELSKDIVTVQKGEYITYTFRVYNEGEIDGYVTKITDNIPNGLQFIQTKLDGKTITVYSYSETEGLTSKDIEVDEETYQMIDKNNAYWTIDERASSSEENEIKLDTYDGDTTPSISINVEDYLGGTNKLLNAYDSSKDENNNGAGLTYVDVTVVLKVSDTASLDKVIRNEAAITGHTDANGNTITDRDSQPENWIGKDNHEKYQDDEDYDNVRLVKFDLALRKFITKVNDKDIKTREPKVSYENDKITYTHTKDVLKVAVGDTVTYTIRVYNEGKTEGFAQTVTDDIPEYLEYLPKNATNIAYRWKMYDKDGKETEDVTKAEKIVTDYTSKEYGEKMMIDGKNTTENPNLLKAFNPSENISENNPEYIDVKVAFKVKDPDSSSYIIKNKAQISEDCDKNGNPIVDIDSKPGEWNEGEDDQDYENVSVEYFDLSLLKYVSEVEVTEKGTTTKTKTGNKGDKNDIIPKVEIHRKNINSTKVKFIYTIKVTNEGDVPGYVKEITDYVPEGLKFYKDDNTGWKEAKDGIITTNLLSNTLLKPGESATVKVTFRWINDENNMGVKTNIAEISKDDNEKGIPDRDSEPGNKKAGEDDIDDADVLLSIKTGMTENIIAFTIGTMIVLLVLAGGVILIKKFVL